MRRQHYRAVRDVLGIAGIATEPTFPHWLGKASCEHGCIDVIFSSGNGLPQVDDAWFEHAARAHVLGVEARVCQGTLLSREQYLTDVGRGDSRMRDSRWRPR